MIPKLIGFVHAKAVPVNVCNQRVMDCSCNVVLDFFYFSETPGSSYWKQVAEERRKALFRVLKENEKVG